MSKNALFLLKNCKNCRSLGALPQTPGSAPMANSWLCAWTMIC